MRGMTGKAMDGGYVIIRGVNIAGGQEFQESLVIMAFRAAGSIGIINVCARSVDRIRPFLLRRNDQSIVIAVAGKAVIKFDIDIPRAQLNNKISSSFLLSFLYIITMP